MKAKKVKVLPRSYYSCRQMAEVMETPNESDSRRIIETRKLITPEDIRLLRQLNEWPVSRWVGGLRTLRAIHSLPVVKIEIGVLPSIHKGTSGFSLSRLKVMADNIGVQVEMIKGMIVIVAKRGMES